MRHSAPYHLLKTLPLALAGFFFSFALAVLPAPIPETATGLRAVSVQPVRSVLAAAEPLPLLAAPLVAPLPRIAAPVAAIPEAVPVAIPAIVRVAVEAPEPIAASLALAVAPAKPIAQKAQARLSIPALGIDAVIREMGYTPEGAMAVPNSRYDVGWFAPGTRPGDIGSAVIGGHNEWAGGAGVFQRLDRLVRGDVVSVVDAYGVTTSFVVTGTRTFDADDENSGIFESASGAHLNLITCSGVYDPATGTYTTRLVVFTDLIAAS